MYFSVHFDENFACLTFYMIAKLGSGWATLTWENTLSEDLLYDDILPAYIPQCLLKRSSYPSWLRWDMSLKGSREPSRSSTDMLGFVWIHIVVIQDFHQLLNQRGASSHPRWKWYLQVGNWEQSSVIRYGLYWWILSPNMILILCNTDCI